MKKEQFRSMVKEIIKEVLAETPANEGARTVTSVGSNPTKLSPDQQINRRGQEQDFLKQKQADKTFGQTKGKEWGDKKAALQKIKSEPGFQANLDALHTQRFEKPLPHKTITGH